MKAVVAAFNQEKALVGAFSVITNLWMGQYINITIQQLQLCCDLVDPAGPDDDGVVWPGVPAPGGGEAEGPQEGEENVPLGGGGGQEGGQYQHQEGGHAHC